MLEQNLTLGIRGHDEQMRQSGRDVYVYFNNDGGGHAVTNARELQVMLGVTQNNQAQADELELFPSARREF